MTTTNIFLSFRQTIFLAHLLSGLISTYLYFSLMWSLVSCGLLSLFHKPFFSKQIDTIPSHLALWSHLDKGDSPGRQNTKPPPPMLSLLMSWSWDCLCGMCSLRKNEWPVYLRWLSFYSSLDKQETGRADCMNVYKEANSLQILRLSQIHGIPATEGNVWRGDGLALNCNSYILNTLYTCTCTHACTQTHTHTAYNILQILQCLPSWGLRGMCGKIIQLTVAELEFELWCEWSQSSHLKETLCLASI